ncbi:MAG: hypothetical protein GY754_26720 [bacterium]|nr:hypothetical protein [bacterium]
MYSNIATLKEEIVFLKNRINQLDGNSGDISNSVQDLAVQVANDRDAALSTLYGTVNNDRATALSSLQTTVNNDRATALSSLQTTMNNDRATALTGLQTTVNSDRTTALNSLHSTIAAERTTALDTALNDLIDNEIKRAAPPGTIVPFGGGNVPAGWLICDGQAYGRTAYSELYQAIGTAWGTPDGSSFNVPDLRGVFLRGVSGTAGKDPDAGLREPIKPGGNTGNAVGSFQGDAYQYHTHYLESWHGFYGLGPNNPNNAGYGSEGPYGENIPTKRSTGDYSTETRPANAYVNYIIKY